MQWDMDQMKIFVRVEKLVNPIGSAKNVIQKSPGAKIRSKINLKILF